MTPDREYYLVTGPWVGVALTEPRTPAAPRFRIIFGILCVLALVVGGMAGLSYLHAWRNL